MISDFVTTIDSDDEGPAQAESSKGPRQTQAADDFDPDFEFDFGVGQSDQLNAWDASAAEPTKKVRRNSVLVADLYRLSMWTISSPGGWVLR
jgi:hypothetical protein